MAQQPLQSTPEDAEKAGLIENGEFEDGDEEEVASGEEGEEEGEEGQEGAEGKKKKRGVVRKRRTAADLNLLREPQEVIVELSEPVLQELSGARKLHQLRYPTYIVCTHKNFQLRAIDGLAAVKGTALKELDLSNNKLMVLDALEQFSTVRSPPAGQDGLPGAAAAAAGARQRHRTSPDTASTQFASS